MCHQKGGAAHFFLLVNEKLLNEKMIKCNGNCYLLGSHDDLGLKK